MGSPLIPLGSGGPKVKEIAGKEVPSLNKKLLKAGLSEITLTYKNSFLKRD